MKGIKERARAQTDHMKTAARRYAWSIKRHQVSLLTGTDREMDAYVKGATEWADRGNTLVNVMQGVRLMLLDHPGTERCREYLLSAIKEYDDLKPEKEPP